VHYVVVTYLLSLVAMGNAVITLQALFYAATVVRIIRIVYNLCVQLVFFGALMSDVM